MSAVGEVPMAVAWRKGMKEQLVTCECHVDGIHLVRFNDDPDLYVSLWEERHYSGSVPVRQRLRHIWRIIRKGYPWHDEIILGPEAVRQVLGFILDAPDDASVYWSTSATTVTTSNG